MAQETMEIVRSINATWAQGDFRSAAHRFDPGITFKTFMPDASEDFVARGFAEFEAFTRDWLAQWREYRIVPEKFQQVAPDTVLVSVRQVGIGRQSGVEVESPGFCLWTLRGGKVAELSLHYDRDKALGAAGLSE